MAQWAYNPFSGNLDRIGNGGGGGNITITGDTGPPVVGNNFNFLGQKAGVVPVMDVNTGTGDIVYENRTWETQYVVDNSTTVGLRGTFSTVQAAVDQAFADGNASGTLFGNIMFRPGNYDLGTLIIPDNANFHFYGIMPTQENTSASVIFTGANTLNFNSFSKLVFRNVNFSDVPTFAFGIEILTLIDTTFYNGAVFSGGAATIFNCLFFGADVFINDTLGSISANNTFFGSITFNVPTNFGLIALFVDCRMNGILGNNVGDLRLFRSTFDTIAASCSTGPSSANFIVNSSNINTFQISTAPAITGTGDFYVSGLSGYGYNSTPTIRNVAETQGNILSSRTVAANYTASIFDYYIGVTDTSAVRTITLPNPADLNVKLSLNQSFIVKDQSMSAGTNAIVVNAVGGQIDGAASVSIANDGASLTLKSDGVNYWTMEGQGQSSIPVFKAFQTFILNSTSPNLTGTALFARVPFDALFFDTTGGFDTSTGVFTVQETGFYNFNTSVYPFRISGTNTVCLINLIVDNTTTYRLYEVDYENTQIFGELLLNGSVLLNMTAGQTVEIVCAVGGSVLNIGFGGTAGFCRFSGQKVG